MATKKSLLRASTVVSIFIVHPLLIAASHTLLRKRSDREDQHDYLSTKILTKLSSSAASPMACVSQEDKPKQCYESLSQPFNAVKCSQCLYGDVSPATEVITCPHDHYCSSVSTCMEGQCPKDCVDEFYDVLDCVWEKAGCSSTAGVGGGKCGVTKKEAKKKNVALDPRPPRSGTAATKATAADGDNPCGECSTSNGGVRHNFCGNLNTTVQDVCSSQTECKSRGLKCQVCTEILNNDGYGGESIVKDVGSGAYICVMDDEVDKKTASSTSKKQKGDAAAAKNTSSSSSNKKKKEVTTTTSTTSTSSTTSTGGYCYSRAVVLGNCVFSKNSSSDCIDCIKSGTRDHTPNPTCKEVEQNQFCTNIATCAKEHCGNCSFEFYAGLNCVLQKIPNCEQFSCAIGGGGIKPPPLSSSSSNERHVGDGYSLRQFEDEVWRQYEMMNTGKEDEVVVREA